MSIRDRVSFLHDETNTLLKTKYLLDTKTDALVDRMEKKKEVLVGLKQLYVDAHATAQATAFLQPGEPVISRYGYGYILAHRGSDDMLQVGDPPRYCCIIYHPILAHRGSDDMLQVGDPPRYCCIIYHPILAHRGSDDMLQVGDPPRYCCIIYHPILAHRGSDDMLQVGDPPRYCCIIYHPILAHRGSDDMLQVGDPPRYCCIIYHPVPYPILTLSSPNLFYPMLQLLPLLVLLYSYRIIYHPILSSPKPLLPFATGHPAVL